MEAILGFRVFAKVAQLSRPHSANCSYVIFHRRTEHLTGGVSTGPILSGKGKQPSDSNAAEIVQLRMWRRCTETFGFVLVYFCFRVAFFFLFLFVFFLNGLSFCRFRFTRVLSQGRAYAPVRRGNIFLARVQQLPENPTASIVAVLKTESRQLIQKTSFFFSSSELTQGA